MPIANLKDIQLKLDQLIDWSKTQDSPAGYFAVLHQKMILSVSQAIDRGDFENGSRLEQMEVAASRQYIQSFEAWKSGGKPALIWHNVFEFAAAPALTPMQHLLLGLNALINFDLALAAASVRQRDAIFGMRHDFMVLNRILANISNHFLQQLSEASLPFKNMGAMLKTEEEGWIGFSITEAREASWKAAQLIAFAPDKSAEQTLLHSLEKNVAAFGQRIAHPGIWHGFLFRWMRSRENGSVRAQIGLLEAMADRF